MLHVEIVPLIIGSVVTVVGALVVIFHRWVLKRVPERSSNWDYRVYVRNTPLNTIIFGAIGVGVGLLTLLSGGLQLL
jgi:hypothetical protein